MFAILWLSTSLPPLYLRATKSRPSNYYLHRLFSLPQRMTRAPS